MCEMKQQSFVPLRKKKINDRHINLNTAADAALRPFKAGAFRLKHFIQEPDLTNRLHIYMWLLKSCGIPAGMYASQFGQPSF